MDYLDVELEAFDLQISRGEKREKWWTFKVRLSDSPAGEMSADEAISVKFEYRQLAKKIYKLDARTLEGDDLIEFGQELANYLLPEEKFNERSTIRSLFEDNRKMAANKDEVTGVRLRLKLHERLSTLPWEFLYLPPPGGSGKMDGFLALDGRMSIVRHESIDASKSKRAPRGAIKLLAAFASPKGAAPLDLTQEKENLAEATKGVRGVKPTILMDAEFGDIEENILEKNVGIFHFAGHGEIHEQMGDKPGQVITTASLLFDDKAVPAEQLAINLRDSGVRLAMLGACNSGRRAGKARWAGIASMFVKTGVPAVVANQFKIKDATAIAFSKLFYMALVASLSIEEAVAAGRKAAFNADPTGRDWGIQVMYMRSAESQVLFGGSASKKVRNKIADEVSELINNTNSGDGTFIAGNVTAGGDVVLGDQTKPADEDTPDSSNSSERGESNKPSATKVIAIKKALKKLRTELKDLASGNELRNAGLQIDILEKELTATTSPKDGALAAAINEISSLVPDGNEALSTTFKDPEIKGLLGAESQQILDWL